jgi:DNA-binding LacI/PurR family transcriptional regulator
MSFNHQVELEVNRENQATMQDVAKLAAVSIATVSRVFSGSSAVLPATAQSVTKAAATLGFRTNLIGRNLRSRRTKTIGVMLPTIEHPVFAECLQSIELCAAQHDTAVLFSSTGYDEAREEQASEILLQRRVDGLILTVANATHSKLLRKLDLERFPFVLAYNQVTSARPNEPPRRCVSVDNQNAAKEMTLHLIKLGHRQIRMVLGKSLQSDRSTQRYQGYETALRQCGLTAMPPIEIDFLSHDFGQLIENAVFDESPPTALFCSNDHLAMNVIAQLQRLGLKVPGDMSVAGFDGVEICQRMPQRLTTVSQPNSGIGTAAVQTLLKLVCEHSRQRIESIVMPHSILTGDTAMAFHPTLISERI